MIKALDCDAPGSAAIPDAELQAARALCEAATKGPWEPRRMPGADPFHDAQFMVSDDGGEQIADCYDNTRRTDAQTAANATFIAAARALVPQLLDEVGTLKAALAALAAEHETLVDAVIGGPVSGLIELAVRNAVANVEQQTADRIARWLPLRYRDLAAMHSDMPTLDVLAEETERAAELIRLGAWRSTGEASE